MRAGRSYPRARGAAGPRCVGSFEQGDDDHRGMTPTRLHVAPIALGGKRLTQAAVAWLAL